MDKSGKKMISGALVLGVSAFIAKALGAVYRIPLTKIIGSSGLGLYQMVFPVYTLLLDFSSAGVPNAVAKIISSYKGADKEVYARRILKISLVFFLSFGALLSILTAALSNTFAAAQGNVNASLAYVFLSPSVFAVCGICCFRGYFQGFMNMTHTAVSQVIEQVVKLAAGLFFARLFLPDVKKAVAGATLAITASEFIALITLALTYFFKVGKRSLPMIVGCDGKFFSLSLKKILSYAVPIALTGMILPISKVADSFIIINFMSVYSENATSVYGIFSGVATTVIGLPVAVCYGISAVCVPMLSVAETERKNKDALKAVLFTLAVAVPCAIGCALFAPEIINILFGYLGASEKTISVNLLRICSFSIILLSLLQTLNGILIGKGNPKKPMIGMAAGVCVKTVIEVFSVKIPEINVYGAAVAAIACYFVADLVNLILIFGLKFKRKENASLRVNVRRYADS